MKIRLSTLMVLFAALLAACSQVAAPTEVSVEEALETLGQISSKHAVQLDLTCEGLGTVTIATNEKSFGVPFDIVGSNDVFIIAEFSFLVTDSSGIVVQEGSIPTGQGKKQGLQSQLLTCTRTSTITRDGAILTVFSTYRGFIVPRGG